MFPCGGAPRAVYQMACLPTLTLLLLLHTLWQEEVAARIPDGEVRQYCQWETFNATCHADEVIIMESARYGRMGFGGCVKENHGHVGCSADVLSHLDQKCSGRHKCILHIPDATLHKIHACPKELMSYLEAKYTCVKVATNKDQVCDKYRPVEIESSLGYLGSVIADETGFGMADCPWLLKVSPGRNVKLTLINFAFSVPGPAGNAGRGICETYLTIKENRRTKNITVCKGDNREREVYVSESNSVQVHILPARGAEDTRKFALKYEAVGCPDLKPKGHFWVKRLGNTAVIKCNHTDETYYLTCELADWVGEIGNCSKASSWKRRDTVGSGTHFPYGLLVVIGIGVALGVAVGIILLMSILLCVKRRKERNTRSATTDPLLDEVTLDNDENNAQCNCPAKIYYSSRLELQRQLHRHALEKANVKTLCSSTNSGTDNPNVLRADPQSLPMPDMCIIETVPFNEILTENRSAQGQQLLQQQQQHHQEDEQREMQTSFITFKPGTAANTNTTPSSTTSTTTPTNPDSCKSCCTRTTKALGAQSPASVYDRRRPEIQTCHAPYGTVGEARSIYDTGPLKNCAECVRDRESIYSTRQRELLNANNLSHSGKNGTSEGHVSGGNESCNQTV